MAMLWRGSWPLPILSSLGALYLVHSVEDALRAAFAEGVDDVAEEDGHEGIRHAVGQGSHRAHHHQQHVQAVRVPEHAEQRHLLCGGRGSCRRILLPAAVGILIAATGSARRRVHGGACWRILCVLLVD
ncbi:hypothetical protein BS78_03G243100 [Paspalum vaginatum]|nr:hypothetical protein BS78_03G243100 [Paspalum vaginatum]